MKIIRERQKVKESFKELQFYKDGEVCFGFPVNENGEITPSKSSWGNETREIPCKTEQCPWWSNYQSCLKAEEKGELTSEIVTLTHFYVRPALAICDCGSRFEMNIDCYGACECPECNQEYNAFGQKLIREWRRLLNEEEY